MARHVSAGHVTREEGFFRRYRGACVTALAVGALLLISSVTGTASSIAMSIVMSTVFGCTVLGIGVVVTLLVRRMRSTISHLSTRGGADPGAPGVQPLEAHATPVPRPVGQPGSTIVDGIFISYRRQDEAAFAGRLYDRLVAQFGPQRVFIDVDSIHLGLDFVQVIDASLNRCRVLVVVIGSRWLDARDEHGQRRLADPHDFVRMEVERALDRPSVRVIPVLVDDAVLPQESELPRSLVSLTRRQALTITNASFAQNVGHLVTRLDRILREADGRPPGKF